MPTFKTALVTGSSSGIGRGIAEALAADGMNIMLNGIEAPEDVEADRARLAEKHGVTVAYNNANLMSADGVRTLVSATEETLGPVDILVNNAGIQHVSPIEDFPDDKWQSIISLNLSAAFYSTKAVTPGMRQRGGGRIINLASAHGLSPPPEKPPTSPPSTASSA